MKRVAVRVSLAVAMALSLAIAADNDTVYLSATGTKYHRETCRTLKKKPTPIERKKAEERGIQACKVCHP